MDMKEIFANGCFTPDWTEKVEVPEEIVPNRKDLEVLLSELSEIKQNIEELEAKQWYLAKLIEYNRQGFAEK